MSCLAALNGQGGGGTARNIKQVSAFRLGESSKVMQMFACVYTSEFHITKICAVHTWSKD